MPRGRRRAVPDLEALQRELEELKQRQAALRIQLKQVRSGSVGTRKLEEKLQKQLASAKWTVLQIQQIQPSWDDLEFYRNVTPVTPTPRGRRRATPAPEA